MSMFDAFREPKIIFVADRPNHKTMALTIPGMSSSSGSISVGVAPDPYPDHTPIEIRSHSDGPGFASADPAPVHTPDEVQRMKSDLMKLREFVADAVGCEFSLEISEMCSKLKASEYLRQDIERLEGLNFELMRKHESMKAELNHAAHAAYHLAALSCSVTGADARAVRSAAERCCGEGDEPDKPEEPRREYREG